MAITFYGSTSKNQGSVGSGTYSFNHDSGTGLNGYLLVQTQGDDTLGTAITGVTYNGVAMTLLIDYKPSGGTFAANCPYVRIWGLPNPASGTNAVVVTYTGRASSAIASTYYGCASTQAITYQFISSTSGAATSQSSSVTGYPRGDNWVIGFASINGSGSSISSGTNTNNRASTNDTGQFGYMNSDNTGDTSISTLNWTCTSGVFWTTGAMQLEAALAKPQMIII